jgi:hypothetical protein
MEKDEETSGGPEGQEDPSGVVESRRRRAPGVVMGEEKEATGSAAVSSVVVKGEVEDTLRQATDEEVHDSGSSESVGEQRASSRTESAVKVVNQDVQSERAASVDESTQETAAGEAEQLQSEEKEPARRKRRGRRSSGTKAPVEESATADLSGLDAEELSMKSWELFCKEVQENGMEIVDDREARKFAMRSVEIARIFLEERARLISSGK